jgi:hypothetical protein
MTPSSVMKERTKILLIKSTPFSRLVMGESSVWMSGGYHFRSGKDLKDRSELFV